MAAETDDDYYLSVLDDLQVEEATVEQEWETRVPTTLAIVQDKSAKLDQEGLPCCKVVEAVDHTSDIIAASNVLQIIKP